MNIGEIQPSTGLSILLAVAAAGIAVAATILKLRNNDLRNNLAQLRALHEQDQQRLTQERTHAGVPSPATEAPSATSAPAPAPDPAEAAEPPAAEPTAAEPPHAAHPPAAPHVHPAEVSVQQIAAKPPLDEVLDGIAIPPAHSGEIASERSPKREESNPADALSEWLNRCAAARYPRGTAPPEPAALLPASPNETLPGRSLVRSHMHESTPHHHPNLVHSETSGYRADLSHILHSKKPFDGRTVALGGNSNDRRAVNQAVILHLEKLIRRLLEEGDFAFRISGDEVQFFGSTTRPSKRNGK